MIPSHVHATSCLALCAFIIYHVTFLVVAFALIPTLFQGQLVVLVWALIRWLERKGRPSGTSTPGSPSALDILNQRYARGEIDSTTFEQMRERLQGTEYVPGASQRAPEGSSRSV